MRKFLLILLLPAFYVSCKKNDMVIQDNSSKTIIETAKKYFEGNVATGNANSSANPRVQTTKTPEWDRAYSEQLPIGMSVIVPIHYSKPIFMQTTFSGNNIFFLDSITQLLIYKDTNQVFHAQVITTFPDSVYFSGHSAGFLGIKFVDDWNGNSIYKFKYDLQGISSYDPTKANNSNSTTSTLSQAVEICNQVGGYNYSPQYPDEGVSWSENPVCNTYFLPVHVGTPIYSFCIAIGILPPGGGGTPPLQAPNSGIASGSNPIQNIKSYMGCFTNIAGASNTYTITVCVDQPTPGSRTPWGFQNGASASSAAGNIIDPGHVFIIFTQTSGSYVISRNLGFYPTGYVSPRSPQSKGMLNDDEFHDYNISLSFIVDNSQFFQIMNAAEIGNDPFYTYDLNANNCTSYILNSLQAGGINLPSTFGTWPYGTGNDPGDLGEDIRALSLSSNESRSTTDAFHQNRGTCQ